MQKKKRIVILGSTGSIGCQTLEVINKHSDMLEVVGLAAGTNSDLLVNQALKFSPEYIVLTDKEAAQKAVNILKDHPVNILNHTTGLMDLVELINVDIIVNALSGFTGLKPTLRALQRGIPVAMANKEPLVAAGHLIMSASEQYRTPVIPIDSEPSAIFQCLRDETRFLNKLIITASGGPFRGWSQEELAGVTPEMALRHPRWSMGKKITVDSATLMNKGLEVIEAHWLFNVDYSSIEVVVHPQSVVHSLVEFKDGSILAHLGQTDMRIPIQYALSYPERWNSPLPRLNLAEIGALNFEKPDLKNFPCLNLALAAGREGGTMPVVLSGADEEAVNLFLQGKVGFLDIYQLVESALNKHQRIDNPDLETIQEVDSWARRWVRKQVQEVM